MTEKNFLRIEKWYREGKLSEYAKDVLLDKESTFLGEDTGPLKISIVIITHNRISTLLRTIQGIKEQQYKNCEIIVIDDASTDDTCTRIKGLEDSGISYIQNEVNIGAGESRKKGYSLATGDILIFSDDDDYYIDNEYFSELNRIFSKNQDCVMVCAASITYFESEDVYLGSELNFNYVITSKEYLEGFHTVYDKPNSSFTLALNMRKMKQIGFQNLKFFNDTSLYLYALLAKGNVEVINRFIGIYRVHSNNMSRRVSADFILDNLNSQKDIYKQIEESKIIGRPEKWLLEQVKITIRYYFSGEMNDKREDKKILVWSNKTFGGIERIHINLFLVKYFLRNRIKRIFKRNENNRRKDNIIRRG